MNPNLFLQIVYAANIFILVPVCMSMFLIVGGGNVFAVWRLKAPGYV